MVYLLLVVFLRVFAIPPHPDHHVVEQKAAVQWTGRGLLPPADPGEIDPAGVGRHGPAGKRGRCCLAGDELVAGPDRLGSDELCQNRRRRRIGGRRTADCRL